MSLTSRDYKAILDIIDTIYSIPDKGAMFSAVCIKLRKLIHIHSAVFIPTDSKTGEFLVNSYEIFHNHEKSMLAYLSHYAPLDPFVASGLVNRQFNDAKSITEVIPEVSLVKSEYACDFLRPLADRIFYVLGSNICAQGDKVGVVGLHRRKHQGDFSGHDKEVVNILLLHMAHSIRNHHLMHGFDLTKEESGVIAVGEDGNPFYMNETARLALKGKLAKVIPEPGLGRAPAFFRDGRGAWRVRTVPLGRGKKRGRVILLERHPPEHKLHPRLTQFHLSRREEEVAMLAVQGLSNLEIAQHLFITEQTVKDHLHHVFGKMKIKRRGELAARVMGLAPPAT